jgi:hypothetical protein
MPSGRHTAPDGDRFLLRVLSALGLHVVVNHGYVRAIGPADNVPLACTLLGTDLRFGAVAFFTGRPHSGSGAVVFTGADSNMTAFPSNPLGKVHQ